MCCATCWGDRRQSLKKLQADWSSTTDHISIHRGETHTYTFQGFWASPPVPTTQRTILCPEWDWSTVGGWKRPWLALPTSTSCPLHYRIELCSSWNSAVAMWQILRFFSNNPQPVWQGILSQRTMLKEEQVTNTAASQNRMREVSGDYHLHARPFESMNSLTKMAENWVKKQF